MKTNICVYKQLTQRAFKKHVFEMDIILLSQDFKIMTVCENDARKKNTAVGHHLCTSLYFTIIFCPNDY